MKQYKLWNNLIGLAVLITAAVVFLLTAEPTTSWWDCGEYIATAYKLQVGHPPGAPTFQLIGRIFTFFAGGDVNKVAYMVNASSALSSAFTILFLFWTITLLGKKIVTSMGEMTPVRMWGIFASGVVGALAYTFSDTFWFSAVEGEVYAMSSFFTAIVFWAVLKWEEQADQSHSLRWLILIAFLIGLAIGVHLLNLLAIPAIVYVYYFKKYPKITKKGMFLAGFLSIILLALILFGIIPGIVIFAGAFEVFAVNSLSLPFNSGTILFFALLIGGIIWGLVWTIKKQKPVLNATILAFTFILIGYTTFLILVIRSNANTPINENEPKDAVSLRAYLGREQYGSTPLFYGNYYTATSPIDRKPGYIKYVKGEDRYIAASRGVGEYIYADKDCTVFPRMYSNVDEKKHVPYYKMWTGIKSDRKPTFGENLKFFFRYQVNFMYWRYFMWNFAGRQNDIQSHYFNQNGSINTLHGNWISGIKFIDKMRLGSQDAIPQDLKNNAARNTFYFFPLILGLLGLYFQYKKSRRDAFIVFLMFFMTGIAIVLYLNQPPLQPRERDYAYAGSFYAFAIWIGLGVMGLTELLSKKIPARISLVLASVTTFFAVPVLMAQQGWDDHDRSQKYAARDFGKMYMDSCDKNSIMITVGDNDTFPLWYLQEVEGYRTDIRVLNYTLAGMNWYVEQLYNTLYDAKSVPLTLPKKFYGLGNDQYIVQKRNSEYIELKELLQLMADGHPSFQYKMFGEERVGVIPTNKVKITLNKKKLIEKGVITEELAARIPDEIKWEIQGNYIFRHQLMLLDILASNAFERPMYIMSPIIIKDIYPPVEQYVQQEGNMLKILPYIPEKKTNTEKTFALFSDPNRQWGNLNKEKVYVDPISYNTAEGQRIQYALAAEELILEGKNEQAKKLLDLGLLYFPKNKIAFNEQMVYYIRPYLLLGDKEKAESIYLEVVDYITQYLAYYKDLSKSDVRTSQANIIQYIRYIQMLDEQANTYQLPKLQKRLKEVSDLYLASYLN